MGGGSATNNRYIMAGLSYTNPDHTIATQQYCWYTYLTGFTIMESGSLASGTTLGGFGALNTTAVLKIARENGMINYYKDDVLQRSVTDPQPETAMIVDFSLFENARSIYSLKIGSVSYDAVAVMKADYYPFGMTMPGRSTNANTYRYAYNGMEQDQELKGTGNSYTTEFRQYDPRLGRWLSLDPLMGQFPDMSPYCAFNNNPIYFVDPFGLEGEPLTETSYGTEVGITSRDNISYNSGKTLPTVAQQKYDRVVSNTESECNLNLVPIGQTSASNLLINIRSKSPLGEPGINAEYLSYEREPYVEGDFLVLFAESLSEGAKMAESFFKDKKPKNTVINVHGYSEATIDEDNNMVYTGVVSCNNDRKNQFDKFDIKNYRNGRLFDENVKNEITALLNLLNMTTDNFALLSCKLGSDATMASELLKLYVKNVFSGVNFYINGDNSTVARPFGRVILDRGTLTTTVKEGWIKINVNGLQYLKLDTNKTGNLIFDNSRDPVIQEEQKKNN